MCFVKAQKPQDPHRIKIVPFIYLIQLAFFCPDYIIAAVTRSCLILLQCWEVCSLFIIRPSHLLGFGIKTVYTVYACGNGDMLTSCRDASVVLAFV